MTTPTPTPTSTSTSTDPAADGATPTPTVPLGASFDVEVPGTPEQVWAALATTDGLSAWFLPSTVEQGVGGSVVTHMGDTSSPGLITAWEPPHRLVYEEPAWPSLVGREGAPVTPLVSEFVVEATSGGTCVVRVVSSAFGTGAEWENEFMTEMAAGWRPYFDNLRLYLEQFAGRTATSMELSATVPGAAEDAWAAVHAAVGGASVGGTVSVRGLSGPVHQAELGALFARVDGEASGLLSLHAYRTGGDSSTVLLRAWLFSDDAGAYVERERGAWQSWLDTVASGTAA